MGWVSQVGPFVAPLPATPVTRAQVDAHPTRCPSPGAGGRRWRRSFSTRRTQGDSLGGAITVRIDGLPVGLGEPVFGKLKARLADAVGSIGAVTGRGVGPRRSRGAAQAAGARSFTVPRAPSEAYGGIQGGLSNGEPVVLRVLFKPPATLSDHAKAGRHDPCILPRAVPVVEAMVSMVLADLWLLELARPHRGPFMTPGAWKQSVDVEGRFERWCRAWVTGRCWSSPTRGCCGCTGHVGSR